MENKVTKILSSAECTFVQSVNPDFLKENTFLSTIRKTWDEYELYIEGKQLSEFKGNHLELDVFTPDSIGYAIITFLWAEGLTCDLTRLLQDSRFPRSFRELIISMK